MKNNDLFVLLQLAALKNVPKREEMTSTDCCKVIKRYHLCQF